VIRRASTRRVSLRIAQLAVVAGWAFAALTVPTPISESGGIEMLASPSGNPLGIANSKNGVAILGASNMKPGESVIGTVTLTNTGSVDSDLALQRRNLKDTAGTGGGALSEVLELKVQNVTGATPATVYNGRLATMPNVNLGSFPKKTTGQTYRFTVTLPQSAGDRYEKATTRVDYVWVQTKSNGNGPKNK
jgi:spore coat-associated protein N